MTRARTVAIVGGGVAGLAAGIVLARRGVRVRLFEANAKVGGCCANTRVDGFTFHDGALYLAIPGMLDAAFARMGLSRERLVPLRRVDSAYTAHLPGGCTVAIAGARVRVARPGAAPAWLDGEVARFLARWRPTLRLFAEDLLLRPLSLPRLLWRGWAHLPRLRGTAGAELRRCFQDADARAALAGMLLFNGLPADELPVFSVMLLASLLEEGLYLPAGGMGRITEALAEALAAQGGEIERCATVRRVVLAGGRTRGVEIEGRGVVECDAVLSTASGMATWSRLVAPEDVPRSMRRRVASAPLSHTAVCVQLGLRNRFEAPTHGNAVLPGLSEQHRVFSPAEAERWLNWSVPTIADPGLAPAGGSVVELFFPRHGVAADDADEGLADRAIAALARIHPLDVAVRRVRTPEQLRDELHLFQGALYGLSPAADVRARFPHCTPIPGLFLAGQTTYPGSGVNPAAVSGILAAERILAEAWPRT